MQKLIRKRLALNPTTIRTLEAADLDGVHGGQIKNSNLTCQAGCGTMYCPTHITVCSPKP